MLKMNIGKNKEDMFHTQKFNFEDFLSRYIDEPEEMEIFDVVNALKPFQIEVGQVWVAGGAVRKTLLQKEIDSDSDFFFSNKEALVAFKQYVKEEGGKLSSETQHQETYLIDIQNKPRVIQLIKIGFYENVSKLLDTFDFTITQFAYDGESLYAGSHSLWDLSRNRLALHKLTYGVATMRRLIKYTNQVFIACAGTMQSILEEAVKNPDEIKSEIKYID
ncbi:MULTISPECIES: hypothetical protein [Bacillus]|uniref:Poly A polymerase head domain-containing protein n=1 Tax=Bacillus altitudinis TaxID=293387 RepID=A0ABV1SAJ7_BACAB|nr:hypothetical protein [Bacillus altitudinis]NOL32724.1 hypothetical protein [Bacillus altitudinis]